MSHGISTSIELEAGGFFGTLKELNEKIIQWRGNVMATFTVFEGLNLIGESVSETLEHVKETLEMGGQLADLSANTGQSVSDLVIFRQALQNSGVAAESAQDMIAKFQKSLGGVNDEGKSTTEALDALGLSSDELSRMTLPEQLEEVQKGFSRLPTAAAKTQVAMDLFGRSGAKMIKLLSEPEAWENASAEVGGFASTMQEAAPAFEEIANNLTTLGQKSREIAAGAFAEIAPQFTEITTALTRVDLTGVGRAIGDVAGEFIAVGHGAAQALEVLRPLAPVAIATAGAFAVLKFQGSEMALMLGNQMASLALMIRNPGTAIAGLRLLWTGNLAGMTAATAAAAAKMRAALQGIGLGLALTGLAEGISIYLSRVNAVKEGANAISDLSSAFQKMSLENVEEKHQVTNEEEKASLVKKLQGQLDDLHEKIRNVDRDYESLGSSREANAERSQIAEELQTEAASLGTQIKLTERMTRAVMEKNAEEKKSAQALQEQVKALEELQKSRDELRKDEAKEQFDAQTPEQQKAALLKEAHVSSTDQVDQLISEDERAMGPHGWIAATPGEIARAQRLVEIRKQLIEVEKQIGEAKKKADEKSAEAKKKADEAKKTREKFERTFTLDMAKAVAQSTGDEKQVMAVERAQKREEYYDAAIQAGETPQRANQMAEARLRADDAAAALAKPSITADSDRRVGLGGRAFSQRTDPAVKAAQDNARATNQLTAVMRTVSALLSREPSRIQKLQPVFGN